MVWKELNYESETAHPSGKYRPKDEVSFNTDLFNWYKKLITIRKENSSLSVGEIKFFLTEKNNNILGYKRNFENKTIWILVNNSEKQEAINLNLTDIDNFEGDLIDLVTGAEYKFVQKVLSISLKPYQVIILK